ncbi:hypothetical protein PVAP13_8KG161802 [Panicum virgatum]|uniref:Uncharacterized protein n=1 Tax=Panicum virgatum TaxID=38727 RepID=A0A8T0PMB5_PANVG|nr:hypothetical protein PVAP13_8KG161802 [Panicum virgatum]
MASNQQCKNELLRHLEGGHMLHVNTKVVINRVAGQIQKQAPFPCFQKLHPRGGGHIRGASGVVTMVIQVHGS